MYTNASEQHETDSKTNTLCLIYPKNIQLPCSKLVRSDGACAHFVSVVACRRRKSCVQKAKNYLANVIGAC